MRFAPTAVVRVQSVSMTGSGAPVHLPHVPTPADLPTARRACEQGRRVRVERIVKAGARSSSAKTLGPVGRRFQEAAMSLVFRYLVTDRSTAWMTGSRLTWDGDWLS